MSDYYILVDHEPVPCEDVMEWARAFKTSNCIVKQERVWGGLCVVLTVFLGLDHNFLRYLHPTLEPLLFETMTFWPGGYNSHQQRCSTWAQAERQHQTVLAEVSDLAGLFRYGSCAILSSLAHLVHMLVCALRAHSK